MAHGSWRIVLAAASLAIAGQASAQDAAAPPAAAPVPETADARPKMRYWLPLGQVHAQAVQQDVKRIAAAGFGALEINTIPDERGVSADQAFAGPEWRKAIRAAMAEARAAGVTIDLAIGPLYPAAVPAGDIGDAAARELVFTQARVAGQFDDRLARPSGTAPASLVGVSAMRLIGTDGSGAIFDRDSVIDLSAQVADGVLRWTPPAPGDWRIVASWARDVGHRIPDATDQPYAVVDHFSAAGAHKIADLWRRDILPAIGPDRSVLKDVFVDSLHLQGYSLWTDALLSEFRQRRGYDLRPYLPMLSIGYLNDFFFSIVNKVNLTPRSRPDFDLSDGHGARIRDDYCRTLTELYAEQHLQTLKAFFNAQGLNLRVQPSYGQSLEGTAPVAQVDIPETESFQQDGQIEAYRVQAGAAHVFGKPVYSAECCALPGMAGKTGWRDALRHVYGLFAGGVNQIVFHGYAQTTRPQPGAPAWVPFGGAFSENYATISAWDEAPAVMARLTREQALLRAGKPVIDVAVLRNSYWDTGHFKIAPGHDYWTDPGMDAAGLTHDYVSPALLASPGWAPAKGRAASAGPGYRAIVVMPGQPLPVAALEALIETARAGVPVLVAGEPPVPEGLSTDTSAFAAALQALKAAPHAQFLTNPGAVAPALAEAGIAPSVTLGIAGGVHRVVRHVEGGAYLWLHNPSDKDVMTTALAPASGVFAIDLVTGAQRLVGSREGAGVRWDVTIMAGSTAAYFISGR